MRLQLREQIRTLQQQLGTTTLFVTHDQEEALSMADRVGVMRQGKLEQIAAPDVLYSDPATAFVAEFVGVSSRVPVTQGAKGGVELFGKVVKIRDDGGPIGATELDALLRPEDVAAKVSGQGLGIVNHRSFLGATTRLGVGIGGSTVKVDVRSSDAEDFELGTRVELALNARDVLITARLPTE